MTDLETPLNSSVTSASVTRRGVIKAAAWSVPVIAVAVAAPAASASVSTAGLAWTGSETGLLSVNLLNGGLLNAGVIITLPDEFTITNGPGAISQTATITVVVGRPSGINLPVGQARGFGVYRLDGVVVSGQNSTSYQSAPIIGQYGFPITTFVGTTAINVPSAGSLAVPIEFGLSGVSTGVSISALASFPVNLTVDFGSGNSYSASTSISIPVGAGLL